MDKKALILIVDDSVVCQKLLAMTLELHGYQTISAGCGRKGIELAIDHQPELVLMDLNLPDMNGYEVTRAIHANIRGWKIPVVAVSAHYMDDGFERSAFNLGFIEFLSKPWDEDALLEVVTKVLTGRVRSARAA